MMSPSQYLQIRRNIIHISALSIIMGLESVETWRFLTAYYKNDMSMMSMVIHLIHKCLGWNRSIM